MNSPVPQTSNGFPIHNLESAPTNSRLLLEKTLKDWGFIPNLHGILAESAPALEAYQRLYDFSFEGGFTSAEAQLIYLTVNRFHGCEYCMAGHTYLARAAELPESVIQAIRSGEPIADPRLEELRTFATAVLAARGHVGDEAIGIFLDAGYSRTQILEVVLIIATKTISNYTNHLTHTPLEDFMNDPALRWHAKVA